MIAITDTRIHFKDDKAAVQSTFEAALALDRTNQRGEDFIDR